MLSKKDKKKYYIIIYNPIRSLFVLYIYTEYVFQLGINIIFFSFERKETKCS